MLGQSRRRGEVEDPARPGVGVVAVGEMRLGAAGFEDNRQPAIHGDRPVSYTHLRAHETVLDLVCRLLLEKKEAKEMNIGGKREQMIEN